MLARSRIAKALALHACLLPACSRPTTAIASRVRANRSEIGYSFVVKTMDGASDTTLQVPNTANTFREVRELYAEAQNSKEGNSGIDAKPYNYWKLYKEGEEEGQMIGDAQVLGAKFDGQEGAVCVLFALADPEGAEPEKFTLEQKQCRGELEIMQDGMRKRKEIIVPLQRFLRLIQIAYAVGAISVLVEYDSDKMRTACFAGIDAWEALLVNVIFGFVQMCVGAYATKLRMLQEDAMYAERPDLNERFRRFEAQLPARRDAAEERAAAFPLGKRIAKVNQLLAVVSVGLWVWMCTQVDKVNKSAEECALFWNYVVWFGLVTLQTFSCLTLCAIFPMVVRVQMDINASRAQLAHMQGDDGAEEQQARRADRLAIVGAEESV